MQIRTLIKNRVYKNNNGDELLSVASSKDMPSYLTHLIISDCVIPDYIIRMFADRFPILSVILFSNCQFMDFSTFEINVSFEKLHRLDFHRCAISPNSIFNLQLGLQFPKLTHLALSDCTIKELYLNNLTNLDTLNIIDCNELKVLNMDGLSYLRVLSLKSISLSKLVLSSKIITILRIRGCPKLRQSISNYNDTMIQNLRKILNRHEIFLTNDLSEDSPVDKYLMQTIICSFDPTLQTKSSPRTLRGGIKNCTRKKLRRR